MTPGQALAVIGEQATAVLSGGYTLTAAEAATVLGALDVAAEYRRYRAGLTCQACAAHPAGLCEDHQADLDAAAAYEDLAARIGGAR